MSLSNNFPTIFPELNLDFANTGVLDPRITFTRASTATYYNGVTTAKAEQNLLLQSQDFTAAAWVNTNSTDSANSETAPDGTVTADTITDDATSGPHSVYQTITTALDIDYAFSCFLKAGTATYGFISLFDFINPNRFATVVVDLSGGTITDTENAAGTTATSSITSVGNGWYRVVVVAKRSSGAFAHVRIGLSDSGTPSYNSFGSPTYSGTSSTIYAWGAQLEQRSAVTAYTPTTTSPITNYIPVLQTAAVDVPRFDYNPITEVALGLLIEEARTNNLTYSQDFADAAWTKTDSSITSNTIVAPDGTLTGDKLVENTANATHSVATGSISFTSGTSYTLSVYAKAAERTVFSIIRSGTGGASARFDLSTLTATNLVGTSALSITAVGNGWYRCVMSWSAGATASRTHAITLENPSGTNTYTGDGYSGIVIWGAQLEAGAFATSYIPTTTTALTRSADVASMTGTNFSSWYNAAEGTLFAEGSTLNSSGCLFSIEQGTGSISNSILLAGISSSMSFRVRGPASATQALITLTGTYADNVIRKYACAFETDSFNAALNGSIAGSDDTSGLPPSPQDNLKIGYNGSSGTALNGTIRRLAYYSVRLTNAQLQALTL